MKETGEEKRGNYFIVKKWLCQAQGVDERSGCQQYLTLSVSPQLGEAFCIHQVGRPLAFYLKEDRLDRPTVNMTFLIPFCRVSPNTAHLLSHYTVDLNCSPQTSKLSPNL